MENYYYLFFFVLVDLILRVKEDVITCFSVFHLISLEKWPMITSLMDGLLTQVKFGVFNNYL